MPYQPDRAFLLNQYVELEKSQSAIAKDIGCSQSQVYLLLKKHNIPARRECNLRKDISGKRFGKLVVVSPAGSDKNGAKWLCECDCGNTSIVRGKNLRRGLTGSCGCDRGVSRRRTKGYGQIIGPLWHSIERGARIRGHDFCITPKFAWELFEQQGGKCALSGVPLTLPSNKSEYLSREWTASLDRIDSKRGYHDDNVQWVHKTANMMKQGLTQNDFAIWCGIIHKHLTTSS